MRNTPEVRTTKMYSLVIFSFSGMSRMEVPSNSDNELNTHTSFRDLSFAQSAPQKRRDLRLHPHAIRTGDYYMFDSPEDREEPVMNEEYDFLERHEIITRQMAKKVNNKKL